ncbi:MAG: hemerythrin domain-containing protein [Dehalococcoidia bacterium]
MTVTEASRWTVSRVPRITQQLREDHYELLWRAESLRLFGDAVAGPPAVWLPELDDVLALLRSQVLVHVRADDYGLYPVVAVLLGGLRATATMAREHRQIVEFITELAALRGCLENTSVSPAPDVVQRLQRLAYGLHAVLQTHLEKEILLYLPVLDERLTPERAGDMFGAMARAAAKAHDQLRESTPTSGDTT